MKKYCCGEFTESIDRYDIADYDEKGKFYFMDHEYDEPLDEKKPMKYCPYCGKKLE